MNSAHSYRFTRAFDELIISAPTKESYQSLAFRVGDPQAFLEELPIAADEREAIAAITIIGDGIRVTAPVNWKLAAEPMIVQNPADFSIASIEDIEDIDLAKEIFSFSGSAAAVRFHDDKGLLSNQRIELLSGVRPNDWQGKTMSSYWPADELLKFKRALLKDGRVENYQYVAFLMTGQKAQYKVDARLAQYRGDLIRIVKSLSPAQIID